MTIYFDFVVAGEYFYKAPCRGRDKEVEPRDRLDPASPNLK